VKCRAVRWAGNVDIICTGTEVGGKNLLEKDNLEDRDISEGNIKINLRERGCNERKQI